MYYDRLALICALVQDVTARMDKLRPLCTLSSPRQPTYLLSCAPTQYSRRFLASSRHVLRSLMCVKLVVSGFKEGTRRVLAKVVWVEKREVPA